MPLDSVLMVLSPGLTQRDGSPASAVLSKTVGLLYYRVLDPNLGEREIIEDAHCIPF